MKPKIFLSIVSILFLKLAFSCDCGPTRNVKEELTESSIVIKGIIIKADYDKHLNQDVEYLDSLGKKLELIIVGPIKIIEYLVVVEQSFKGAIKNDTLIIRTKPGQSDCGLRLTDKTSYIFYAQEVTYGDYFYDNTPRQLFMTSACSRTKKYCKKEIRSIRKVLGVL